MSEFKEKLKSIQFGSVPGGTRAGRERADQINQTEKNWDRDMPAYQRLRRDGLQPPSIDGSAHLEAKANEATEVANGLLMEGDTGKRIQALHEEVSSKAVGVGD